VTGTPPPCLTVNRPIVTISKAMTTATPTAGQPVAYTITVCNTGSAPETGVIIHDTIDTTWLDPLTLNAPGGTYMAGPPAYIEWTIPTLNPGLPCTTISYDIELEEAWANQRVCNFAEIFGTSGIYNSCGWDLPAGVQACFPSGGNQLLKNCCTMPCNVAATFGTGLPPYKPIPMPPPATPTNDTGVTDINNPLCFYQVQQSTTPKSVRIVKSTVADTMDIYY
jgi:uncharacterized repeat protein (TIGR01451 family)